MEVEFADDKLDRLETDLSYTMGLSVDLVRAYRRRMQSIRSAVDKRDFYSNKSFHFEKLGGRRGHQHSIRLNDQFRLVLELAGSGAGKRVRVVGVEDYH